MRDAERAQRHIMRAQELLSEETDGMAFGGANFFQRLLRPKAKAMPRVDPQSKESHQKNAEDILKLKYQQKLADLAARNEADDLRKVKSANDKYEKSMKSQSDQMAEYLSAMAEKYRTCKEETKDSLDAKVEQYMKFDTEGVYLTPQANETVSAEIKKMMTEANRNNGKLPIGIDAKGGKKNRSLRMAIYEALEHAMTRDAKQKAVRNAAVRVGPVPAKPEEDKSIDYEE